MKDGFEWGRLAPGENFFEFIYRLFHSPEPPQASLEDNIREIWNW